MPGNLTKHAPAVNFTKSVLLKKERQVFGGDSFCSSLIFQKRGSLSNKIDRAKQTKGLNLNNLTTV